jgi:hypothetical protein
MRIQRPSRGSLLPSHLARASSAGQPLTRTRSSTCSSSRSLRPHCQWHTTWQPEGGRLVDGQKSTAERHTVSRYPSVRDHRTYGTPRSRAQRNPSFDLRAKRVTHPCSALKCPSRTPTSPAALDAYRKVFGHIVGSSQPGRKCYRFLSSMRIVMATFDALAPMSVAAACKGGSLGMQSCERRLGRSCQIFLG